MIQKTDGGETPTNKISHWFREHWSPLILWINLAAYIGFALIDGPVWCRDSDSYATMDYTREPIYPTFLWIMRKLFGENVMVHGWDLTDRLGGKAPAMEPLYLMAVILCQSILAAIAVWLLAKFCYEIGGKLRFAAMANLVMWGVDLLNRFGAKRGSTYTQSIMTEGFGISFYILFLLSLFRYLQERRKFERPASTGLSKRGISADARLTHGGHTADAPVATFGKPAFADCDSVRDKNENGWKKYLALSTLMMVVCASQHKQLTITLIIFAVAAFLSDLQLAMQHKGQKEPLHDSGQKQCGSQKPEILSDSCQQHSGERKQKQHASQAQSGGESHGNESLKWLGRDICALLIAGAMIFLIGHVYNLTFHGVWSFHTGSADKIDSTLLYTVTEEDVALFAGEIQKSKEPELDDMNQLRDLFLQIEEELEKQQLRYVDAPSQYWVELCSHYADSYDIIGFEVLDPLVDTYVRTHRPDLTPGSMEFAIATDHVCQSLEHILIRQNLKRLLYLWINNVRKGFVNTVLRVSTLLNWASLILWITYLSALLWLIHGSRHKDSDGRQRNERSADTIRFASLVLLGTLVNCAVVGAIIFPQTRYMIYNMGLFYITLLMMLDYMKETFDVKKA